MVKRKPSIDVYSTAPLMRDAVWSRGDGNKRGHEAEDGGAGSPPKRIHSTRSIKKQTDVSLICIIVVSALSIMFFIVRVPLICPGFM